MSEPLEHPVVTIDGPSGAGKGTVARLLALKLGFHFLDSGAVYRAAALHCLKKDIELENAPLVVANLESMKLEFEAADGTKGNSATHGNIGELRVILNGSDVTRELRSETTADAASRVAVKPAVRQALLQVQREFCVEPGLVADGRDMGTVVFPHALVKIFLTASSRVRAKRRQKQLKEQGMEATLAGLMQEIERRDARDSSRKHAPLLAAADAITIDTSDIDAERVSEMVMETVSERLVGA